MCYNKDVERRYILNRLYMKGMYKMIMNEKELKNIFQSGVLAIKRNAKNKDV